MVEAPAEGRGDWAFCCRFKEHLTLVTGNKETRAVRAEMYREAARLHEPCAECRRAIDASQRRCGNPFGKHLRCFRRRLQRVRARIARRLPALAACRFVCDYCVLKAKRELRKRKEDKRILEDSRGKIKDKLKMMGLGKEDVRRGIIQVMKKPHVALLKMHMNDHWKNNGNRLSIKDVPQSENSDNSDNYDQRSLCSYDGAEEETNNCEELILPQNQHKESYLSDSLTANRVDSVSENCNSNLPSSLQVNVNIKQNLFSSNALKIDDSKFRSKNINVKKRHSLPAAVVQQCKIAKRSQSYSSESPKKVETSSSLKLTIKRDLVSQEYRISSQNIQLTESKNLSKVVNINPTESCKSSNFTNGSTYSDIKSSVGSWDSDSTEIISKSKVCIDNTVPELELHESRPVNMSVNRSNLENSLSPFLKSKLKRNLRDTGEVESKRQKITDDSVAVNINVNITVNSLLEGSVQKQQPLELKSSNDNSQVLLPKTSTNICSTSDFSSCNESDNENTTYPQLNSNMSTPKNSYSKNLVYERNTDPVKSTQEILHVDHNCNIEKEISKTNEISLENSENETKETKKIVSKTKNQQKLTVKGNLKIVFRKLFGEVSDASETEDEIIKKRRRKSRDSKKREFVTNGIVESVEKNQSKTEMAKQNKSMLKDFNWMCSLNPSAMEIIADSCSVTEMSNAEISSVDNNVQTVKLPENQPLTNIQTDKLDGINTIDSKETNSNITDKNISKQIDSHEESSDSQEISSHIIDQKITKEIDECDKNSGSEHTKFYITDQSIPKQIDNNITDRSTKQIDEFVKSSDIEENNFSTTDKNIQKEIDEYKKNCGSEETKDPIKDENSTKQIDEFKKSCNSEENSNSCIAGNNIPKEVDEYEKRCNSEETNSYIIDDFSSKDQVMPDCAQSYDQVDLEGGDFEFMSSVHKNKSSNEYSDDEYNDCSDFDVEYDEPNNIEYSSDIEVIENHKNPSTNKDLRNVIDEKSHFTNNLIHKQECNDHNLNALPSFYNEDVTNFVNKDIIDTDDEDIVILNDFGPAVKVQNKKSNFNANKNIKAETVIDLESDEEIDIIEEVILKGINDNLLNKVINNSKEPISNNIINHSNIERTSETCQSPELDSNNLKIKNAIEKTKSDDKNLNVLEFHLGKSTNEEAGSSMTLTYLEENGASTKVILDANKIPVPPDTEVTNNSEVTAGSTQETEFTVNTVVNHLIEDALKLSVPHEKSTTPNKSVADFSNNILVPNSETLSLSTVIADDLEDILELNRKSVSPNALVIDETADNDDFNISQHFTTDVDQSVSNEMVNSETKNNSKNSNTNNSVKEVTSSVDKLRAKRTTQFTGNVCNDLNNPNILQEFNLAKEIVAPEEIKNEPVTSDNNNIEQEVCENLLEEFKKNSSNTQEQSCVKISVREAPEVLINQSVSNSIPSNIMIEVTVENPEKLDEPSDWMDLDDLNKKRLKTTRPFKCRDINELLENPVNKNTETSVAEASNLRVQKTVPSEIAPSTTNSSNSTINMVHTQNNSSSVINEQNNLLIGNNLIQSNVPEPIYMLSRPINQIQNMVNHLQCPPQQIGIPQQIPQPVLNTVNATLIPQYIPQMVILNSVQNNCNLPQGSQTFIPIVSNNMQNRNTPQGSQNFIPAISNNMQNQNLPQGSQTFPANCNNMQHQNLLQGNPQTFTSTISNNIMNLNLPQRNPQTASVISNNMQNQNLLQGNSETFTPPISKNIPIQNLSQGNPQGFTPTITNNVQNQTLSQGNLQTSATTTSNNVENENDLIFASSMFTNMFAHKNSFQTVSSKPQTSRSDENIPIVVPQVPNTIFSLPILPAKDLILPRPLSITPRDNEISLSKKVQCFRRLILTKIKTELDFLKKIPLTNVKTYIETFIDKQDLTTDIWNFHIRILSIMKCFHAICSTTSSNNYKGIVFATINSLKHSEEPQTEENMDLMQVFVMNKRLGDCGYQFKNTTKGINPIPLELQPLQDKRQIEQHSNLMSMKQKEQLYSQLQNYKKLLKTHEIQVNLLRENCNVEIQNVIRNSSVTIRPVNIAISNNSTDHNSLQKSSLNDNKKIQLILSRNNETVQKNIDKSQTNSTKISVSTSGTEKNETNTKSMLDKLNQTCLKCEKTSEIVCSNCLSVAYCSRECQYNHWKEIHYKTCENHLKGIKFL